MTGNGEARSHRGSEAPWGRDADLLPLSQTIVSLEKALIVGNTVNAIDEATQGDQSLAGLSIVFIWSSPAMSVHVSFPKESRISERIKMIEQLALASRIEELAVLR